MQISMQLTNRSQRAMTLEFALNMQIGNKDGSTKNVSFDGEWYDISNPIFPEPQGGQEYLSLAREETADKNLIVRFNYQSAIDDLGIVEPTWSEIDDRRLTFTVRDRISGEKVTVPFRGYPVEQQHLYIDLEFAEQWTWVTRPDGSKEPLQGIKAELKGAEGGVVSARWEFDNKLIPGPKND